MPNVSKPATISPRPEETKFNRRLILTDGDLFTRIWFQPRLVFSYLQEYQYNRYTFLLLFLASSTVCLELSIANHLNKGVTFDFVITMSIIAGGAIGTTVCYIFAAVASAVGSWFGSFGTTVTIARAIAFGLLPVIIASLFTAMKIIAFERFLFRDDFAAGNYSMDLSVFYFVSSSLQLALASYSLFLIVVGISQVQRLPIGQAILNLIIPAVILAAVAGIITMPFL